ncbi:MAG: ferrous iron transport protein A [Proteobacteria bacterium]|nr:ferrous iron transport protein A [Pseudomonadota bacterium]
MFSAGQGLRPLALVAPGEKVTLVDVRGGAGIKRRLTAIGLRLGSRVRLLHNTGRGPVLVMSGDMRLALGRGLAHRVWVR